MVYPWLNDALARLLEGRRRFASSLLIYGPKGGGAFALARRTAEELLCKTPDASGHACGRCEDCKLAAAGTHPDLRIVTTEALAAALDLPYYTDAKRGGEDKKTLSREILLPQVRATAGLLDMTSARSGARVVVIYPAEAIRAEAAAALLKAVEEPPEGVHFIFASESLDDVLPTLRSRSRLFALSLPDEAQALSFLAQKGVADARAKLAFEGGSPVAVLEPWHAAAADEATHGKLLALLRAGKALSAEGLVTGLSAEMTVPVLCRYFTRWASDLLRVRFGLPPDFFPDEAAALSGLAAQTTPEKLLDFYDAMLFAARDAEHPLNAKQTAEGLFWKYRQAL